MEFNPLDKTNLGISVRDALLKQEPSPMYPAPPAFNGAGIYAMYYTGAFPSYERIARKNRAGKFLQPIYAGKAVPAGARKGGIRKAGGQQSSNVSSRLREHARSIDQVSNLRLEDFFFRYLIVDDIWIPLGETFLIDRFEPLWNKIVDGFGIHTPGKGRKAQFASAWDTLHPGRAFVSSLGLPPNPKSIDVITREIDSYLSLSPDEQAKLPVKDDGEEQLVEED